MAFKQEQKKAQKQKVFQSSRLIKAISQLEKLRLEIQDSLDLERITDVILEEVPIEPCDDGSVPDVDEDGRVNEDIDWDSYLPKDDTSRIEREIRRKALPPIADVSSELTYNLKTHLISQLILSKMNVVQKNIGAYLIGNLNENGYLDTSIEELWQKEQKYQFETWHETLRLLQKFDPKGVAARDLQECLLIQAKSEKQETTLVEKIIKYHWNNLLNMKCDTIAKSLSVPVYDIHAAISIISSFNPRPGQQFNKKVYFKEQLSPYDDSLFHIQPDFYIYKNGNDYRIEPKYADISAMLRVDFHEQMKIGDLHQITKIKVHQKNKRQKITKLQIIDPLTVDDMKELVENLKKIKKRINQYYQYHKNIINAIKSIVRFQKDFFDTGSITNLRPLIARDVADEIELDESTVRRIRKNKYIDTPHGIFELDFFFDQVGYDTRDGLKMASKGVKELIKNIVKLEDKEKPCRDKKITDMLRDDHNIKKIEPRTVGKYREAMGILPAKLRMRPC